MPIGTKTDGQTLSAAEVNTISADIATNTTALAGKQPLDSTLSSLATLTGAGVPYATGTDAFTMRAVGAASTSDLIDRSTGDARYATVSSPTFTGVPAAPTAAADTNTTQLASTAYVIGQASVANPAMNGTVAVGTSTRYARADHVHASDTSRAPLASPALTGTPTVPTAAVDTNTTQAASTAFVVAQAASASPVMNGSVAVGTSTRYARADHVHASDTTRAPLASPALTGTPTAPTAAAATNTTQVATTAFAVGEVATAQVAPVTQFERSTTGALALNRATHQGGTIMLTAAGATVSFSATTEGNGFVVSVKNRTGSDLVVPPFTGATRWYARNASHTSIISNGDATLEVLTRGGVMYVEIIGDTL
jgi:hypothetical protein